MVGVYKRGDILYIQYKLNGKNIQKSTRLKDTKENRKVLQDEVIPLLKLKLLNSKLDNRLPRLFEEYSQFYLKEKKHLKTIKELKIRVSVINSYFGKKRIDSITKHDIKVWIQEREALGNSPKTITNYLSNLRGIINVAIDMEVIVKNVAHNIKLLSHSPVEVEPFSEEEVKSLLSQATGFLKYFLAFSFYTGGRTGEILALMQSDINLESKVIEIKRALSQGEVRTPKTFKSIREVPIFDDLIPYIKEIEKKSIWLFPKNDGLPYAQLSGQHKKEWKKLLNLCNITYRKIYATRHTFIVSMLKNSNLSIMEIAQIVGHTSTQMIIQHYAKYIKGEQLKVRRDLSLFTDKKTDILS